MLRVDSMIYYIIFFSFHSFLRMCGIFGILNSKDELNSNTQCFLSGIIIVMSLAAFLT